MKRVLIANSQPVEAEELKKYIQRYFHVSIISEPSQMKKNQQAFDLVLIDHNFTINAGMDFLMKVLRKKSLPILMLTPADDPQCAIAALRAGAFNYLVKTSHYFQFINIAIDDAIRKFNETKRLKETISDLRKKLKAVEKKTGLKIMLPKSSSATVSSKVKSDIAEPEKPEPKKEINLVEEIISRFKKGDVNLPTLPKISLQFNDLIVKGANLKEVAEFLKRDVAISSKLINVSNSVLYKGVDKSVKLEDAITRLGLGTTRQYVEIISNRSLYTSKNPRFSGLVEKLWEHSLACAYASDFIVNLLHLKSKRDLFILGLTHDIGKLVLVQLIGEFELKGKYIEKIEKNKILGTLNVYHGRFGAVLLKRWGFPQEFRDIAMYHDHFEKVENPSHEYLCVHFANLLVNSLGYSIGPGQNADLENSKSGYMLRLRPDEIEIIKDKTREYITNIKRAI